MSRLCSQKRCSPESTWCVSVDTATSLNLRYPEHRPGATEEGEKMADFYVHVLFTRSVDPGKPRRSIGCRVHSRKMLRSPSTCGSRSGWPIGASSRDAPPTRQGQGISKILSRSRGFRSSQPLLWISPVSNGGKCDLRSCAWESGGLRATARWGNSPRISSHGHWEDQFWKTNLMMRKHRPVLTMRHLSPCLSMPSNRFYKSKDMFFALTQPVARRASARLREALWVRINV